MNRTSSPRLDRRILVWRLILGFGFAALAFAAMPEVVVMPILGRDPDAVGSYVRTYLLIARGVAALIGVAALGAYVSRRSLAVDIEAWRARWRRSRSSPELVAQRSPTARERTAPMVLGSLLLVFVALVYAQARGNGWSERLARENGPMETATVVMYLVAAALAVGAIVRETGARERTGLLRWWLVPLLGFFLLVAGEETNWGQTYLQYRTPTLLSETNTQEEVSLHNIRLPAVDAEGRPYKRSYWADNVLRGVAGTIGLALPLAIWCFPAFHRWLWAAGVPLPSRMVQVGFAVAALLPPDRLVRGWFEKENMPSELRELVCAGFFLLLIWQLPRGRRVAPPPEGHSAAAGTVGWSRS